MLFLWIFGDNIEQKFGKLKYLGIYLMWGIVAGLVHIYGDASSVIPAVGRVRGDLRRAGRVSGDIPQSQDPDIPDAGVLLEDDAHPGKMVSAVLAGLPEPASVLHRGVWSRRRRRGIPCPHRGVCNRSRDRLPVQKDARLREPVRKLDTATDLTTAE